MHNVFVYGTLKRGEPNHNWILQEGKGYARFIDLGTTVKKYPLVIGTKYNIPFILDSPGLGHNVVGEVYAVDDQMLQHLDVLEDHPTFYTREIEQVQIKGNTEEVQCWLYFLKKFKPAMLKQEYFTNYSSRGAHGLVYGESNNEATLDDL